MSPEQWTLWVQVSVDIMFDVFKSILFTVFKE